MTDISVSTVSYQAEKRSWLLGPHGTDPGATPSITLDVSAFTAATHYPNGYFPSGIVLGVITASGLYGPYDDTAVDGRQVAAGILFSSVKVPNTADTMKDVGAAMLVHGFVKIARLPIANGATGRGYIDANGQTDLKLIHFVA
ncbi:head decoration protein [Micromonospora carbonacea]|uniref:head decoration protein n=1 Tax=Micromonospora carbonacea TaxID=47853 RepID=UPI0033D0749E